MTRAWPNHGHIVVMRPLENGTDLYEFWSMEQHWWYDGGATEDPVLKVYVALWSGSRDTARDGLPIPDERAADSASWSEAPDEIQDAFIEEMESIEKQKEALQ